jgi:hypothetical protein
MQLYNGFILLIVMVFLLIFSALSLYGLTHAATTIKMMRREEALQIATGQAKKILRQVENTELELCQIPVTAAYELTNKTMAWWEKAACWGEVKRLKYYYVMEVLDKIACANYQRITLFALPASVKDATIVLQSTVVKLACIEQAPLVQPGRQMLRILRGME